MRGYIDLHCDTLMTACLAGKNDIGHLDGAMADLERLRKGGCLAQFFAIFMLPESEKHLLEPALMDDAAYIAKLREILLETIKLHPEALALAGNFEELEANRKCGKTSAFLTLEDGRAVDGKLEDLERFHELGVRLISLTWNGANCFGAPNSPDPAIMKQGLTSFGKDAVARMGELGIIVDVSHLSDGGFWDVADICKVPFVASHSNCRALAPHRRNLTDEMIRALADKGGVAGLNFAAPFLSEEPASTAERLAVHARHLADKGGVDCVAIGSDFDGISKDIEIDHPEKMGLLFDALARHGFSEDEIDKAASLNALRVIRETLK